LKEGEPRPWAGAGEPLRFPGGSEARTPLGGRPGGQQPPRFWGLPFPTRRDARREGDGPFPGRKHAGAALEVSSGGAALAEFGRRVGALRAGRGQRPATPRGDAFPPPGGALRRRGGGLKLGVQAGAEGVGAEGAQRPEGRRIGLRDEPAPRARLSLKPIKPIYTYWVPFSVLAKSRFRYWRKKKLGRAKTLFGLGPKLGLVPIPGQAVDNF
jgi:hypothetical protein